MDLSSLLNTQVKEEPKNISLQDIQHLLASNASNSIIIDKLRNNVIFSYSPQRADSFVFFDTFIQLLLTIDLNNEHTKSIVIDAFRNCMNGLLQQHGNSWLIDFPMHLTKRTWTVLRAQPDVTLLVYLYGLVLTFTNTPDWITSIVQFMHSNHLGIVTHLWLTCCCTLDENEVIDSDHAKATFLDRLESRLAQDKTDTETKLAKEMIHVLKIKDTQYLMTHVNKYLGGALAKPMFTVDDFHIGYFSMQTACQSRPFRYSFVSKLFQESSKKTTASIESFATSNSDNPLLNEELLETWTPDKYAQAQSIRKGTLFWIQQMSTMPPATFDMYLKKAIVQHYPTDRKTVLDLLLADWTMRDRFHRHLEFISDILLKTVCEKSYNKRTAPYYAFVQLFNIPDEHHQQQDSNTTDATGATAADASYYETKSGAYIDLSQFSNCSDLVLMQGCCRFLEKMTLQDANVHVKEWVGDCLHIASSDIVQHYVGFLANGLNEEISEDKKDTSLRFAPYLQVALKACVCLSAYALPILLQTFHLKSLEWLLKRNAEAAAAMMAHYFDDGPQVSKYVVVQSLFVTKPKQYVDLLLAYLRDQMPGTYPKLPKSRAWFKNHFLGVILSLVGEDPTGQGVACRIFRQLFKTRDDFEWYFATSLVPTEKTINFKPLDLSNSHDIYAIKNSGLAALLQEMVRLGDTGKKERLIQVWYDLWTTKNGSKFTVPASWVLQCAGLYDQAPVIVKQMIKKFVNIGLSLQQEEGEQDIMRMAPERKFLDRIMDLVLLSDTPEPDNLFELILNVSTTDDEQRNLFQEINSAIINILVELSEELEMELLLLASQTQQQQLPLQPKQVIPPPSTQSRKKKKMSRRMIKKNDKMTARKLRIAMKKHEEELEKYLLQQSQTNNAIKALTTLVQRVFGFLLRLLNYTMVAVDSTMNTSLSIKQDIQHDLIHIPLFYEPLAKLVKLIREPEDLHEDIQTTADLCLEYLKKQPNTALYETCQKIFSGL